VEWKIALGAGTSGVASLVSLTVCAGAFSLAEDRDNRSTVVGVVFGTAVSAVVTVRVAVVRRREATRTGISERAERPPKGPRRCDTRRVKWRVRVALAPLRALFVVCLVVCATLFWLATGHDERSIVVGLVFGLFVAGVGTAAVAVARRREQARTGIGAGAGWSAAIRAMLTGDAPADASLDEGLLTMVTRRRTQLRRLPWIFSVMALLYLVFAIRQPHADTIVIAALWSALSVVNWIQRVRDAPRLARLEETLRAR
jgi:hypothetical protein